MAIDFPATPSIGEYFTSGTTTWQWDGSSWKLSPANYDAANLLPSQTGNSGKFLTTDGTVTSWGTVSQVYALISSTSFSGSNVIVDNIFSSSYKDYEIVVNNLSVASAVGYVWFRFRSGGADVTSANYTHSAIVSPSVTTYNTGATSSGGHLFSARYNQSGYVTSDGISILRVLNPNLALSTQWTGQSYFASTYNTNDLSVMGGRFNLTNQFTGISFYHNQGVTMSGNIAVYGINR